jgi:hypothetical protein
MAGRVEMELTAGLARTEAGPRKNFGLVEGPSSPVMVGPVAGAGLAEELAQSTCHLGTVITRTPFMPLAAASARRLAALKLASLPSPFTGPAVAEDKEGLVAHQVPRSTPEAQEGQEIPVTLVVRAPRFSPNISGMFRVSHMRPLASAFVRHHAPLLSARA